MKSNRDILRLFLIPLLAIFAVSCVKDDVYDPNKDGTDGGASSPWCLSISAGRELLADGDDNDPDTRARYDIANDAYYWSAGTETIVMSVAGEVLGSPVAHIDKHTMTANNATETLHTNFKRDISLAQYDALVTSVSQLDYYAYYANGYTITDDRYFPRSLEFIIPSTFSAFTPNSFDQAKTPMVAVLKNQGPNIIQGKKTTGLAEDNEGIHMNFEHTTSYLALDMDVRLMTDLITSITMTVTGGTDDENRISGTYVYNIEDKEMTSLTNGSNSVTLNISGGLLPGNNQKIYIPMPVKTFTNQTFTFTFTRVGENPDPAQNRYAYADLVVANQTITFERGKIHTIRVAPAAWFTYASGTNYSSTQITRDGLYWIEAWGGNGGHRDNGYGGESFRIAGLYRFTAGQWISMFIGSYGGNTSGSGTSGSVSAGGTNGTLAVLGTAYGYGGSGSYGGTAPIWTDGQKGAAGGAATFVFVTPASPTYPGVSFPNDIVIVSGGGGGSGGGSSGLIGGSDVAGAGGDGAEVDDNDPLNSGYGTDGGTGNSNNVGIGGKGDGTGGEGGSNGAGGGNGFTNGVGGAGGRGGNAGPAYSAGGGGGGGGGGWITGGGGGEGGGARSISQSRTGGGGGGAGGQSFRQRNISRFLPDGITPNPAYPANFVGPEHDRFDPATPLTPVNGYVYITFVRE